MIIASFFMNVVAMMYGWGVEPQSWFIIVATWITGLAFFSATNLIKD